MLELLSPKKIQDSPYRERLAEAGVCGGWNYALDHAWLSERIDQFIKARQAELPIILDVGCGNSMLHTFLEEELSLGIIGIDRIYGACPYPQRDHRMDMCIDFAKVNVFFKNSVDIVYWCSSIEHNTPVDQKKCVAASLDALKPGGLFLATFGFSRTTHYYEPSEQWNLSAEDAKEVFGVDWVSTPDFDQIASEYREDIFELDTRHFKRYNTREYDFVVAAAEIINNLPENPYLEAWGKR